MPPGLEFQDHSAYPDRVLKVQPVMNDRENSGFFTGNNAENGVDRPGSVKDIDFQPDQAPAP